jgi:chitinase
MRELRAQLGNNYLLTAAMSQSPNGIDAIEYDEVNKYVDWISIMSYDFHGSWEKKTGHNSPLYNNNDPSNSDFNMDSAVKRIVARGMPRNKVML